MCFSDGVGRPNRGMAAAPAKAISSTVVTAREKAQPEAVLAMALAPNSM